MSQQTKFLVFSDLHHGNIMPDCQERLEKIIRIAEQNEVDFIVNLGDFAWACEQNNWIRDMWNNLEIPHYLIAGNHDFDSNDKETFKKFYNLESTYYTFDHNQFHFIALDTNYYRYGERDYDYAFGNYYPYDREYISKEQLEWLEADIRRSDKICVLLSHVRLNYPNTSGGCGNYKQLHELLLRMNEEAGWKKVCLAINGHNHTDSYQCWDGIHHIDINSASNEWVGSEYGILEPNEDYDEEVHKLHPYLKYVIPYKEPLCAIITLDGKKRRLEVRGMKTSFIGPSLEERGHSGTMGGTPITPIISDLELTI